MMPDALDSLKNALADRYTIVRELGAGGMATVYLAHDIRHNRKVAVKVLRPELAAALGTERFLNEIKVTANLNHPHILPLLDSGTAASGTSGQSDSMGPGEFLYYVMPFVEGESLRQRLDREKQLSIEASLEITKSVARALDYAHRHNVIHRDIKPGNILFQDGEAVVADFGIAFALDSACGKRLTETGLSLGTPAYMSPEQASGERTIDGRSDVYSLACVLYEMLAGDPPFTASSQWALLAKHVTDTAPPITTVRPSVPQAVANAIARSLGKSPSDRFETAQLFAEGLTSQDAPVEPSAKAIVVLPFQNLSPDPENEYFSDGLTDELIADLSKLHSLRVISRNSAMQLKGTDKDTRLIGRELCVQYVLEGTVRRSGNRLRITAQLIDAEEDAHLWTEKYDGVLEDVFDMQEQVSRSIVDALEVELSPSEQERLAEPRISDVAAHECYLRARADILLFNEASLDRALELLDRGLEIVGPNDTLYAEKSHAYAQHVNVMSKPVETFGGLIQRARALASKALELNPNSGAAEMAHGLACHQSCDPKGAIRHLTRAVELKPSDAFATAMLGFQLAAGGRDLNRARQLCQRAEQLDPLVPMNKGATGWAHWFACDFAAAIDGWSDWQREADTQQSKVAQLLFGWLYAGIGDLDGSIRYLDLLAHESPEHTMAKIGSVLKLGMLGQFDEMNRVITEEVEKAAWWDDACSYIMAQAYALSGDLDRSAHWLSHAIDYGFCNPHFLTHEPHIENLRSDRRFEALFEKAERLSESLLD